MSRLVAALVAVCAVAGPGRADDRKPSPETLAAFEKVASRAGFYYPDGGGFVIRDTGTWGDAIPAFWFTKGLPNADLPPCEVPFGMWVSSRELTDAVLARLARTPNLTVLALDYCPGLTDAGFAALAQAKHLTTLRVRECPLSDAGLAALAKSATLAHVKLAKTRVTATGLGALGALPTLRRVSLVGDDLPADALAALPLDRLDLSLGRPTDAAIRGIRSKAKELHVRLDIPKLGEAAVCDFLDRHAVTLTGFEPEALDATDAIIERLSRCAKLRVLKIRRRAGCKPLTDQTLARLAGLTELTDLDLAGADLSPAAATTLKGFTKLRALNLASTELLPQDLEPLVGAVDLRVLDFSHRLYDLDKIVVNGLSMHKIFRDVEDAARTRFLSNGAFYRVGTLAKFTGLRELNLSRGELTAANLAELYPLVELRELDLSKNWIARVPASKAPALPRLADLNLLQNFDLTVDSVAPVAQFPALRLLRVGSPLLPREEVSALRKRMPNCEVLTY